MQNPGLASLSRGWWKLQLCPSSFSSGFRVCSLPKAPAEPRWWNLHAGKHSTVPVTQGDIMVGFSEWGVEFFLKYVPPQAPSEWGGAVLSLGKRSWKASQMISTLPPSPGGRAGHKPCGKKSLHLGLPSLVFSKWTQNWEPFHDWQ